MPFDIDARIRDWQARLLDTTRRNRLVKFATGRGGGLNLLRPTADDLWRLLVAERALTFPWKRDVLRLPAEAIDRDEPVVPPAPEANAPAPASTDAPPPPRAKTLAELTAECAASPRLAPEHLLTDLSDKKLATALLRLARTASESETDHGVSTLYAAFGFLRWYESTDSTEELLSPLALLPVRLTRESVEANWVLCPGDGDPAANHCLAELLAAEFRLKLPAWAEADAPGPEDDADALGAYLKLVADAVRGYPRWEVVPTAALGVFNFQKLAMWEDLKRNAERVKAHALCRAVAGDTAVQLRPPAGLVAAHELDEKVPPDAVAHILDADSSQHEAIEAVKRGADVVIDGPPGTGKSQTIANAIAELLAAGKTVLFVSEKTAALEVVKRRLDACGLGDFCLELHSHKANKREVAKELGRCLELRAPVPRDTASELAQLAADRRALNAYAAELHRPRPPLGFSAFRVHGELARLAHLPARSRWAVPDALARDASFLDRATDALAALPRCREVLTNPCGHPWRGCALASVTQVGLDDARHHLERLAAVLSALCEGTALADLALAGAVNSVGAWREAVAFARGALAVPTVPARWFEADPRAAATAARDLHADTTRARALAGALADFDPAATLSEVDARSLTSAPDRLAGGAGLALRARLERARELVARLDALAGHLDTASTALARLLAALLQRKARVPVKQLRAFAAAGTELANGPALRPGWWDARRREELRTVVAKAAECESAAGTARAALAGKLMPAAFEPASAPVVTDALRQGGSFWRRLFGGWGALHAQVSSWYVGAVPDRAGLLADLAALAEFHRHAGYARQVEAGYPPDLVTGADGRADWAATADGLLAAERCEKWKPSAELKAALAPGGTLDRVGLRAAANELADANAGLRAIFDALPAVYAGDPLALAPDGTPDELAARVRAERDTVAAEIAALEPLSARLREGRDLPAGDWRARVADLAERTTLRARYPERLKALGERGSTEDLEGRDWSEPAAVATALLAFLGAAGAPPTPALAAALSDPAARERVRAAVALSDRVAPELEVAWAHVAGTLFPADAEVSDGIVLARAELPTVRDWARARRADLPRVEEWVRYVRARREASELGLGSVVEEVVAGQLRAEDAAAAFRSRFFALWLDALYAQVPELERFATDDHERLLARFAQLDRATLAATPVRLRANLLSDPARPRDSGDAPATSELGVLKREANKQRRHVPVRKLFAETASVLPRLKPCLMMSPLAVSTYLSATDATFDAVIFDEASQVRPHDAVCAIFRGRQLVVAGDQQQLPPTDFFARAAGSDDDETAEDVGTAGFESLLDVCLALGLVRKPLRWHYRSRREALIAFSNRHFYGSKLVTFPSADDATGGVTFERVADGRFDGGANAPEAKRVAELVMRHARERPNASLGVIAFSQAQQNRIEDELEAQRKAHPDLEPFFKEDRAERFFVKNLENVQGDERDAIVLSVGYGPDALGRVHMRFGPLNRQGGERRLNVAITRARSAMTVVSSMTANDIDLTRTGAAGPKLLRAFLQYAEQGPSALAAAVTEAGTGDFDSPFEAAVCAELRRRGLTVHTQIGCGGYRIDMAVVEPGTEGRYALGVECDGATYHSSATARDRDRLRQSVLEGLGWRLCRIWSTDWLRNREKQVQRVLDALAGASVPPPAPPPAVAEAPTPEPPLLVAAPVPPAPSYASIDAVPELLLRETVLAVLTGFGATGTDDLCKATARRLGFERLGARIRTRIEGALLALEADGTLARGTDDRWVPRAREAGK